VKSVSLRSEWSRLESAPHFSAPWAALRLRPPRAFLCASALRVLGVSAAALRLRLGGAVILRFCGQRTTAPASGARWPALLQLGDGAGNRVRHAEHLAQAQGIERLADERPRLREDHVAALCADGLLRLNEVGNRRGIDKRELLAVQDDLLVAFFEACREVLLHEIGLEGVELSLQHQHGHAVLYSPIYLHVPASAIVGGRRHERNGCPVPNRSHHLDATSPRGREIGHGTRLPAARLGFVAGGPG